MSLGSVISAIARPVWTFDWEDVFESIMATLTKPLLFAREDRSSINHASSGLPNLTETCFSSPMAQYLAFTASH
jgi:hypothetical protein